MGYFLITGRTASVFYFLLSEKLILKPIRPLPTYLTSLYRPLEVGKDYESCCCFKIRDDGKDKTLD